MNRFDLLVRTFGIALLFLVGCSQGGAPSAPPVEGQSGGACYPNKTCNAGLLCQDDLCVLPPDGNLDGGMNPDGGVNPDGSMQPSVATWKVVSSDVYRRLRGISGTSSSDIWIVGERGAILHHDGRYLTIAYQSSDMLNTVFADSATDVWAAGYGGAILHYNGSTWNRVRDFEDKSLVFNSIWARGPNDVWAVGAVYPVAPLTPIAVVVHYDGTNWTKQNIENYYYAYAVWGNAAGRVWIGASGFATMKFVSAILRPTGGGFTTEWSMTNGTTVFGFYGYSDRDVWAAGESGQLMHYDGATWSLLPKLPAGHLRAFYGATDKDLWVCADSGVLYHYDGTSWLPAASYTTASFVGIWGASARDIWAIAEDGTRVHYDGSGWSVVALPGGNNMRGLWAASPDDLFAAGDYGSVVRYRGTDWQQARYSGSSSSSYGGIWGTAATDVWAIGAELAHFDGSSWTAESSPTYVNYMGLWGSGRSDIWAVGGTYPSSGTIAHYDGTRWKHAVWSGGLALRGVWGSGANSIWAVGETGPPGTSLILRYDGTSWAPVSGVPAGLGLYTIWGRSATEIWAGGAGGTLLRYDGTSWTVFPSQTLLTIQSIWSPAPNDLWIGAGTYDGTVGALRHYDGKVWTETRVAGHADISGIWGRSAKDAWAVSLNGAILRYD